MHEDDPNDTDRGDSLSNADADTDTGADTTTKVDGADATIPDTTEADAAKAEADADAAETPEEKAERERTEEEARKKANIRIPKARFDEAQAKARAREQTLLDQIEDLKGGRQAAAVQDAVTVTKSKIEELQDTYEDLILDGRKDDARKVRRQIDKMREELTDYQTSVKSDAIRRSTIDELTYNAKLANFESTYPALNPDSEEFSTESTGEVAALLKAFVAAGTPRAEALAKAVKYVLGAPLAKTGTDVDPAQILSKRRAEQARAKAAAANSAQPANANNVGLNSDKDGKFANTDVNVMRLSQDSFAKLDDETKIKLRGDEV